MRSEVRTPVNVVAFTGVMLLGALGITGCTSGQEPVPSPAAPVPVNGLPDGVSLPVDVPTDVPNNPADRVNVAIEECESTENGWRAGGHAVNPGESEITYEITVFFTTDSGTVLGHGGVASAVPASETAEWSVDTEFVAPETTQCVLRGVAAG